jgi:2-oxoglutarate ferredoxin oxidoreductase subunit beta
VARSVDVEIKHLGEVLKKAAEHEGASFVEVLQNCNIFNDGAWDHVTTKEVRDDSILSLEQGKPLVFGKNKDKGIRLNGLQPEVVQLGGGITEKDLIAWDEKLPSSTLAYALSQLPEAAFPMPIGVFRQVEAVTYESGVRSQIEQAVSTKGQGDLKKLIYSGDIWDVKAR